MDMKPYFPLKDKPSDVTHSYDQSKWEITVEFPAGTLVFGKINPYHAATFATLAGKTFGPALAWLSKNFKANEI